MIKKHLTISILFLLVSLSTFAQEIQAVRHFEGHKGQVEYLTFNPDGTMIASAGDSHDIYIHDAQTSGVLKILKGHTGLINHLEFAKNGALLASASNDGTIKVWNVNTGKLLKSIDNPQYVHHFKAAFFVTFDATEEYLYFGGNNMKLSRAKINGDGIAEEMVTEIFKITAAVLSPDKEHIVYARGSGIVFWNIAQKKMVKKIKAEEFVNDLRFSDDGTRFAAWSQNGKLQVWDFPDMKASVSLQAGDQEYSHISFSKDSQYMISGNTGSAFKLWDLEKNELLQTVSGHGAKVRALQFSPDGKHLATGSYDGSIKLWALALPTPEPVVPEPVEIVPPATTTALPIKIEDRAVKEGLKIWVKSTSITLDVWDDKKVDGDIISLYYNDSKILTKHKLERKQKTIKLKITADDKNYLTLYAHNLGSQPPNTAAIIIKDGVTEQKIQLASDFKASEAINIIFEE